MTNTSVSHVANSKEQKFEKCMELDLTGTLIRRWTQLFEILQLFPNLKILHLKFFFKFFYVFENKNINLFQKFFSVEREWNHFQKK